MVNQEAGWGWSHIDNALRSTAARDVDTTDVRSLPALTARAARTLMLESGETDAQTRSLVAPRVTFNRASVRGCLDAPVRPGTHAGALLVYNEGSSKTIPSPTHRLPCLAAVQQDGAEVEVVLFDGSTGQPLHSEALSAALSEAQTHRLSLVDFVAPPVRLVETGPWLRDRLHGLADRASVAAEARTVAKLPQSRL